MILLVTARLSALTDLIQLLVTDYYNCNAQPNSCSSRILYNDIHIEGFPLFDALVDVGLSGAKAAMKHSSTLVALLLGALGVASPAIAQQEASRGRDFLKGQHPGETQRSFVHRNEQRKIDVNAEQAVPRDASTTPPAEELKPIPVQGQVPGQGRERLSPEERRQLRRDINAAGRDIYRRNRPD